MRARLGVAIRDRRPGRETGASHGEVLVPTGEVDVAERPSGLGILQHHHAPALAVAATRREPSVVEDASDDFVGDRLVGEVPNRGRAPQRLDQVHDADLNYLLSGRTCRFGEREDR